jgi:hypothetical protein
MSTLEACFASDRVAWQESGQVCAKLKPAASVLSSRPSFLSIINENAVRPIAIPNSIAIIRPGPM